MEIKLPKEVTKAERVNPQNMIIFGQPKVGKTTALVQLPNHLLIDYENGSKFVDGIKIAPDEDMSPSEKIAWLKQVAASIKEAGRPYDYICIDSLSLIDENCEVQGTLKYMNTVQGKSFNRDDKGNKLDEKHPDFQSVHTLPNGYGYAWSRAECVDIYDTFAGLAKICTIFVCHVSERFVLKSGNSEVLTKQLSLTGKVKDILCRRTDAIGYVYNEDGKIMISFESDSDKIGGIRGKHIAGYNGPLDWSKLFIKD